MLFACDAHCISVGGGLMDQTPSTQKMNPSVFKKLEGISKLKENENTFSLPLQRRGCLQQNRHAVYSGLAFIACKAKDNGTTPWTLVDLLVDQSMLCVVRIRTHAPTHLGANDWTHTTAYQGLNKTRC